MKIFMLLPIIIFSLAARAEKSELKVQELSTVRVGDPIRLGVLVQGEVKDQEIAQKLYDLVVFQALDSEQIKEVESKDLALALRKSLTFQELQMVSIKIPEKFRIRAQKNFIYPGDIRNQITLQSQNFCPGCEVRFDDLRIPNVKGQEEVLGVKIDTSSVKSAGGFVVSMNVETSKGRGQYWVTGKISTYKNVLVAKKLLRQGERISSDDVEDHLVNVSYVKDGNPSTIELNGKILNRSIQIGQPIFFADLKKEMALRRGQPVRILITTDTLEVATQGIAEEAGAVGDTVKVKGVDSQKLFSGTIVENGTVRVQ